ncbi:acyl-CoA dehydrogenase family protein [Hydrogenophaga sp.]|uniref:acyl-CoA dehydrogenase family protein n=1 Tax=Hydrogenophaga sp. TaxID=1904254 RepID=UPI003F6E9404
MPRTLFSPEHDQFRDTARRFMENEVAPRLAEWEVHGTFDSAIFARAGLAGLLCPTVPEAYGGAGADILCSMIVLEEGAGHGNFGLAFSMHSDIVTSYLLRFASEAQKRTWLPRMVRGEAIGALAMTEPSGGSDVKAIRTVAVRDGDDYLLSGSKTFITNATVCDLVIVVAKTDAAAGARGISLFLVDMTLPGITRGQPLRKVGLKAQDTGELFFDQVRVPASAILGELDQGFGHLMEELPWERLQLAVSAVAACEAAYAQTVAYVRERRAFGQAVGDFQNTRFVLADLKTEITIGRVFVDHCMAACLQRELDTQTASMAKLWCSELQARVMDACVQLHGGNGFMAEYAVARAWVDARAQRIYGGTNEIMRELISRRL